MNFKKIEHYVTDIKVTGDLLEIGSDRGEGSTHEMIKIALNNNKIVHSVDMDPSIIDTNIKRYSNNPVKFYNLKGEEFLDQYTNFKFSVILLDNFDWNWWINENSWPDFLKRQQDDYKTRFNIDMNNNNSQISHLTQAMKVAPMMTDQCVVICDDTFMRHDGTYDGKGGAVVPYLMSIGFEPIIVDCGIILQRK